MRNHKILRFVFLILLIVSLSVLFWKPLFFIFSDVHITKQLISQYGAWAPIIFILLFILQTLVAPIPSTIAALAAGFIFGPISGVAYCLIGSLIGYYLTFMLSRKFGRPFVQHFVSKKVLNKYDNLVIKKGGLFTLFLVYLLPFLPEDAVCYLVGLSKIRLSIFMIISMSAKIPGFLVLCFIGAGFGTDNYLFSILLLSVVTVVSVFIIIYRKPLEHIADKELEYINNKNH